MDWVELVWPMLASACFVLAVLHMLLWLGQSRQGVHPAFAVAATSVGAIILFELASFNAASPEAMAAIIRWWHVPIAVLVWSIIYHVHSLSGDRSDLLLGGGAAALRLAALVLNFTTGDNLNFASVDGLGETTWLGAEVSYPVGQINPWMVVAQASNLMLLLYLANAMYRMARASGIRSAGFLACAGWMLLFVTMVTATLPLILGLRRWPLGTSLSAATTILLLSGLQAQSVLRGSRLESLWRERGERDSADRRDLELATAAARFGLWRWDLAEGGLTQSGVNAELLGDAGGAQPEQVLFGHAEDGEDAEKAFLELLAAPKFEFEYRIRHDDGRPRWILLKGDVEHDADGRPHVVRGVTVDITRRKEEAAVLRTLLQSAPSALLLVDSGGVVQFANHEAARMFDYVPEAMPGLEIERLVPEEIRVAHVHQRGAYQLDVRPREMARGRDPHGLKRGGEQFPVEVRLAPIELDGQLRIMVAVNDLTMRRKFEHEIAMEREAMAHLARVTMLGELSGSLAHELNQPLAAILSNAQAAQRILKRDPIDLEQIQEILGDIVDTDRRAGQVISRLRGMLRREAREFAPLDVNEVVQDCMRLMRNDLLNRRVSCRLNLMPGLPHCAGDTIQLQQVLMNLIRNACDALPDDPEHRVIRVRTWRSDAGVCTEVIDSGSGIPEDMLERIFVPFETTKATGMGMGLAVCQSIVRAHGGRIWAENVRPQGARVSFELPPVQE